MEKIKFADGLVLFFQSYFQKNHGFIEDGNPSENVVIVDEDLDGIDIDDIRNLADLPRLESIDEECGNLRVVNDGGELTRNINKEEVTRFTNLQMPTP